jgi:transposase
MFSDHRNEQLAFLADFSEIKYAKTLHSSTLAKIFKISLSRVRELLARARSTPLAPCRPVRFTPEQKEAACHFIEEEHASRNSVTQRDLLDFVDSTVRITLTYGWVKCFLH